jgi:hypothetical protein
MNQFFDNLSVMRQNQPIAPQACQMCSKMLTDAAGRDFLSSYSYSGLRMTVDRCLKIPVLLAAMAAQRGDSFQLFFCQVRTAFRQPCFTQVFTYFGIGRIERD